MIIVHWDKVPPAREAERIMWKALDEIAFCAKPEQAKDIAIKALNEMHKVRLEPFEETAEGPRTNEGR